MSIETHSPEANYITRDNIVHPLSNLPGTQGDLYVAAAEAKGRLDIQNRLSASGATAITAAGGSIKKGK
jgi:hypothetical protein